MCFTSFYDTEFFSVTDAKEGGGEEKADETKVEINKIDASEKPLGRKLSTIPKDSLEETNQQFMIKLGVHTSIMDCIRKFVNDPLSNLDERQHEVLRWMLRGSYHRLMCYCAETSYAALFLLAPSTQRFTFFFGTTVRLSLEPSTM